jgi:heme-degrading monooxygenase HmoA
MIRVVVEHHTNSKEDTDRLIDLIHELRMEAMKQPGYITGETLISAEDPRHILVISTWNKEDQWKAWDTSEKRTDLTRPVKPLLETPYTVTIFNFAAIKAGRVMLLLMDTLTDTLGINRQVLPRIRQW